MSAPLGGGGGGAGFQYKHLQANESIQAFLRSFLHEKHRWNELVEATLLYGIHCIAQNYSLQTLNVDQVQHITRTLLRKPQHYFVHQQRPKPATSSSGVALKPSSVWRHGTSAIDEDSNDRSVDGAPDRSNTPPPPPAQHSIPGQSPPPSAPIVRDGRRDMDEWTHVLGKPWVDAAWQAYVAATGYPAPSTAASDSHIASSFRDLKRSIVTTTPSSVVNVHITSSTDGHVSFLDFLRGFVVHCIATPTATPPPPSATAAATSATTPSTPVSRPASVTPPRRVSSSAKGGAAASAPSKLKQELDKHMQHVLRVRKTNTQRMHEALAKSRIASYEPPVRRAAIPPPLQSLATTAPGAKALEIAHMFATSQFMQELPEDDGVQVTGDPRRDPNGGRDVAQQRMLRTELYGHHDVDAATLPAPGCVAPPPDRRPSTRLPLRQQPPLRGALALLEQHFKGWLGDYGPPHTKTVVPADWTDLEDEDTAWLRDAAAATRRRGGHSWDLDRIELDERRSTVAMEPVQPFHGGGSDGLMDDDEKEGEFETDPAFEWLVHDRSNDRPVAQQRDNEL